MKRVFVLAAIAAAVIAAAPTVARAQAFLTPFVGATFGNDAPATKLSMGAALSFLGKDAGLEIEVGYTPDFFNQQNDLALIADSNVTTVMANIMIGPEIGRRWRPYGIFGAGLLRSRVDAGDLFDKVETNDFGIDVGGGVLVMLSNHVGLRGDLRYFRSLQDPSNDDDLDITVGKFDFWRGTGQLALKF